MMGKPPQKHEERTLKKNSPTKRAEKMGKWENAKGGITKKKCTH